MNIEETPFDCCNKVDLHVSEQSVDLSRVVAIANEHGFRAIAVPMNKLDELNKRLNTNEVKIISVIDYPFGTLSKDVRSYSIFVAKEKGAEEVEILIPLSFLNTKDFKNIEEDLLNLITAADKSSICLRYVLEQNNPAFSHNNAIFYKTLRLLGKKGVKNISTSLGFFDEKIDHSENILKMRSVKTKSNCNTKAYVNTDNANVFSLYPKAGADLIGVDWKTATYLVHAYNQMVLNGNDNIV